MKVQIGDKAPDFTLNSHQGEEITLSEVVKEGPVVLVFFPLAFSGTCTGELCEIRDNLSIFEDKRVKVMGISVDSKFSLKAWADSEGYQFSLLSDFWPHGETAQKYGVFLDETGFATRATIVINSEQIIVAAFENGPGEARNLEEYKQAIEQL